MAKRTDITEEWRTRELLHGRPGEWVPRLFKGFSDPRHLAPLDDVLSRATRDGNVRALVSAPPRHGKSTLLSSAVVRHLALRPGSWVMWASHSAELADAKSREIRDAAIRAGLSIRKDSARLSRWELAGGGGFIAAGVGSSNLTGQGASLLVADDVFGSRAEAESPTTRDTIDQWWSGTFATRATPDASLVLSGTRWHLDDLHSRISERDARFELVNLPAISDDGCALWPEVWPLEALEAKRAELGQYDFSSLYQGSPIVRGESLFVEPQTFTSADLWDAISIHGARIVVAVDPAAGVLARNDYSAVAVMALTGGGPDARGLLMHMWRGRLALPDLVRRVIGIAREYGASLCAVEGVGGFRGYADAIKAIAGNSLRVHVPQLRGDKFVRAQPLAAAIADGRVRVPDNRPAWLRPFLDELLSFPVGPHSPDQIDACSLGFNLAALGPRVRSSRELSEVRRRIEFAFSS